MVFFTIKGKRGEYPYTVLKGKFFYLRVQEIIAGKNNYRNFPTSQEKIKDLSVEVIDIDIEPSEINKVLSNYFASHKTAINFNSLYLETIKKNYEPLDLKQSFDFYQNLCYNYGVEKLSEIIYLVIYKNVSKNWIAAFFKLDLTEVDFILDYLPVYYNFIDFDRRSKHGVHSRSDI